MAGGKKTRHWTAQILGQIAGWDMGQASEFKVVRRFYAMGVGLIPAQFFSGIGSS